MHMLYRDDDSTIYYHLKQATRQTTYAALLKPCQRGKEECGAYLALITQYAAKDKWGAEPK